jgi:hypothetical protein
MASIDTESVDTEPVARVARDTELVALERAKILARADADPLLSYAECAADLGISLSTFKRYVLPDLPVVEITARRRGIRRSAHEARKARQRAA